ncbi:CBO0543 family protein [Priestia endophytica]|uniref:CBO0543 family protein n=1 Tax=Priestia endophytica TaxID=135735 RepID=UPI00384B4C06
MKKEVVILVISWLLVIILYIGKVPRDIKGKAPISFLFAQTLSWVYIFYSVYFKRVEFPFREFPYATKLSFSLYYMIYPAFSSFFHVF